MARDVADLALLLSVIAGPDPRVPGALSESGSVFWPLDPLPLDGLRVAVAPDLGGAYAVDDEVAAVVESAARVLAEQGATVTSAYPSLPEAEDTFRTLRAWHFQAELGGLLAAHPDDVQAVARGQHPCRRDADRGRRGPRLRRPHDAGPAHGRLLR